MSVVTFAFAAVIVLGRRAEVRWRPHVTRAQEVATGTLFRRLIREKSSLEIREFIKRVRAEAAAFKSNIATKPFTCL